ncbi:helix-turn-helix domain-containing protein [Aerococcus sp. Group 1]|uniref:helix-turn-helix domain-containing protein n=1 Tax=Aerococcus urinae (strain CCUG 59500 / ACS-120-V-Col10a) TaxID=2976812 RepID=UPI00227BFD62|nr:helix-turn-helix transcriptional regulator [Aerococcus sp. Group 1]MCY3031022.1 helix-turn-helix domain-containing protein [Aerococcus sp. Group 1]MCY3055806.1 helix-turn-helix domain-containing protein [Aerococcus sp. Group 1]MCY3057537.1 helix-turn-helix domain-containing protein [Aerococcus sp. Group 1]MCY3061564.1 helix-turn-helix domain-containing protein [Aerococcus sp. Group 1]
MFSDNLTFYRRKKKLTQADLGKHLNVSPKTIGSWERGRTEPSLKMLEALANYFNISIDTLLGYSGYKKNDLKNILRSEDLTYEGNEISEDNLRMISKLIKALLSE